MKKSYEVTFARWQDAVRRMCGWYSGGYSGAPDAAGANDCAAPLTPQPSFKLLPARKKNGSISK